MNELIKIEVNENQEPVISGRALHEFLEVKTSYKDWFPRMVEYGFTEGVDFNPLNFEQVQIEGSREVRRQITDHAVKLNMAKELAMIQRTEKGKQARQYFIQIEKDYNSPEKVMARALIYANKKMEKLEANCKVLEGKIAEDRPKVLFAEAVSASDTSILIGDLAKILKQNGYDTGQKRLFEILRDEGFLMKSGTSRNMPIQKAMEIGLFEVKETTINNPDDSIRITKTTKCTGKGQQYFVNYFLTRKAAHNIAYFQTAKA